MKTFWLIYLTVFSTIHAETLRCVGVLGNSGEQGETLVRFGKKAASGMGVVHDASGELWDRAGADRLNRYAVDGRLLGTYPLKGSGSSHDRDRLIRIGDVLMMKLGSKLFTLPLDAPTGTAPTPLKVEANRLSFNTHEGFAAAALGKRVFLVNAAGETRAMGEAMHNVDDIEIGPEGTIYFSNSGKLYRIENGEAKAAPGNAAQWLNGHWYGTAWHGTLRRFDANLLPDPGVVLGGASGSFIGYVEGNHELNDGNGLAHLRGSLFAASGTQGVLHLMEWKPQRFTILRRIGAVAACRALSIDGKNRIWHHAGYWEWKDGPDAPLRHSTPPPDEPGFFGAAALPSGVTVAPGLRWGNKTLYRSTDADGPALLSDDVALPDGAVASAVFPMDGRQVLWVVNAGGEGMAFFLGNDGTHQGSAGSCKLHTTVPLDGLTSLAGGDGLLYAAANGHVIEFSQDKMDWRETQRWNSWGENAEQFGGEIHLTYHDGGLWVSDTLKHRVIRFDPTTRKPMASFGEAGKAGDSLLLLNEPRAIASREKLAVVFDSSNQRLMKLEYTQP